MFVLEIKAETLALRVLPVEALNSAEEDGSSVEDTVVSALGVLPVEALNSAEWDCITVEDTVVSELRVSPIESVGVPTGVNETV